MSTVSVIIVSYYTGPSLWLAMESVLSQPECSELHLVNNGNFPGDEKRLRAWAEKEPRIKLHEGQGNVGFAKACNLAAKVATGKYIMLLNPDSMLDNGSLGRALGIISEYPDNTLAGCYLINPDGSEQRGGRRALLTPENGMVESLGLNRFFPHAKQFNYNLTPMPTATHEVPATSGAFMLLSKNFYDRLDGLDEAYFLHMEDMDLCYRVRAVGGKIICMPEVKVLHFRSTSETSSAFIEKQKAKGFVHYLNTHFSGKRSSLFLTCMTWGIWLRCGLKSALSYVNKWLVPPLAGKQEIARLVLLYRLADYAASSNAFAGKTILVTGASGQIGLSVIGKALAQGANVVAIYNKTRIAYAHPRLQWVQSDLSNVQGQFETIKADVLIHTAALWLLPKALPALIGTGLKRVIAFSSTSVLGKNDSKNKYEQNVVKKLEMAEEDSIRICKELSAELTLLRPTMVYGVGLDANLTRMADVIKRFGFLALYLPAKGQRHPVQATDLADAALEIISNANTYGKIYNTGGVEAFSYKLMVENIFKYLGIKPKLISVPFLPHALDLLGKIYQMPHLNGEIALRMNRDLVFAIQPAIDDFNYHPKGFLEGDVTL